MYLLPFILNSLLHFKSSFCYFMYVGDLPAHVCLPCLCSDKRGQKGPLDPLELELQTIRATHNLSAEN